MRSFTIVLLTLSLIFVISCAPAVAKQEDDPWLWLNEISGLVQFAREIGKTTAELTLSDTLKFDKWKAPESTQSTLGILVIPDQPSLDKPPCKFKGS
ncbi:MAG TPA: hypothetical protein VEK32_09235 [Thermodesulfobacteriota bacterium]|nr:hypothetical protein [Thermodesulfobacteriota bacterium]